MLQMGSIYGQVSSPSPQQMQPPFYDSNPAQGAPGRVQTTIKNVRKFQKSLHLRKNWKFKIRKIEIAPGRQRNFKSELNRC